MAPLRQLQLPLAGNNLSATFNLLISFDKWNVTTGYS